jgi:nucleolar protein 53
VFVLFRVKSIRKEIDKETNEHEQLQEKRKVEYEHREKYGTKKFGRYKFEDADLDLNLSEEITGNLRTMKVNDNKLIIDFCVNKVFLNY